MKSSAEITNIDITLYVTRFTPQTFPFNKYRCWPVSAVINRFLGLKNDTNCCIVNYIGVCNRELYAVHFYYKWSQNAK